MSNMKVLNSEFVQLLNTTLTEQTADGKSCTRAQLAEILGLELSLVTAAVELAMTSGELVGFSSRRGPGGGLVPEATKAALDAKKAEKLANRKPRGKKSSKKSSKGRKARKVAEAIVAEEVMTEETVAEAV